MINFKHGYLVVIAQAPHKMMSDGKARKAWYVKCECGNVNSMITHRVKKATHCSNHCPLRKGNLRHGTCVGKVSGFGPTYTSWCGMRQRCNDQNHVSYANYGGRGIKVDPRWDSFNNFKHDMGERPAGMTLERKDPDLDYTPDNCRWATHVEQATNKRNSK